MKKRLYHIIYRTLGILLVAMGMAITAGAQKSVTWIEAEQCDTTEFSVVDWPGDRYTWDIYRDSTVNFATTNGDVTPVPYFVNGMYQGSTVKVVGLQPGRYFLRVMVWDEVSCTNNLIVFGLDVIYNPPYAELYGDTACYGEPTTMKIVFTGTGPWNLTYTFGNGTTHLNLNGVTTPEVTVSIPPLPVGPTEFWILEVSDQCTVNNQIVERTKVIILPKPSNSRIYTSSP